jgi:UPF0755 protein
MKRWLYRLLFLASLLAAFLGVAYFCSSLFQPISKSTEKVSIEVPRHATARQIARVLAQKHLIRHAFAFLIMARVLGEGNNLRAGEYELQPNMTPAEIIDKIARGDAVAQWFTIPEGYTVDQVAEALQKNNLAEKHRFLRLARSSPRRLGFDFDVPRSSLEGYLFPDSYKVKVGVGEAHLIRGMLRNFEAKVVHGLAPDVRQCDLPLDKAIIVASMIEREAKVPQDRPLISAVIRNRLERKMPLQIDATVLYALGYHKSKVLNRDLAVGSPYNTYRRIGLPPGPICSPGLDSIKAALRPAHKDYLYYVARPDGSHIFSRTLAEHQSAIRRARASRS